ncbi:hypothetical protein WG904_16850 [Pedobacter sp. Du54]|uniref:hypothetical protein n=1 Tax=Pedobacter anseongensis TaxID=3133439 RepID=UPI0030A0A9FC
MENEEKLQKLFALGVDTRGNIINQTIMLERLIDEYLSNHFCKTQKSVVEIMDLIFGNKLITFESKHQVFREILNRHNKDFQSANKTIHKDIDEIIRIRNIMAHYLLDTEWDVVEGFSINEISFIKFDKKRKKEVFTIDKISSHLKMLDETINKIIILNSQTKSSSATPQES